MNVELWKLLKVGLRAVTRTPDDLMTRKVFSALTTLSRISEDAILARF